jgi:hypothetical protein
MRQIQITNNAAPKLRGNGALKYRLWADGSERLYVQVEKNAAAGTFSPLLYPVARYEHLRKSRRSIGKPVGFDFAIGAERSSDNNNDGAFVKAVLCHLLDGGACA